MNDIDPICTKMTAVNMALNGVVGEVLCMNGLDITGETYRFGYQVEPSINFIPPEMVEFARLMVLAQTGEDIKKQYVLRPISYEQTFLKRTNDTLLAEYKERQQIEDKAKKEKALQELQEQVKARMAGTLFENDTSQVEHVDFSKKKKRPSPTSTPKKNKLPPQSGGTQGSLF